MSAAEKGNKRTVFIGMDGSKHAIYAFEWYVENVHRPSDNVIMGHCAEHGVNIPPTATIAGNPAIVESMIKEHESHVMDVFRTIDRLANQHGIQHTLERLHGHPGEAVIKAANREGADLLIIGSRGHGTVRRTIMGSISDYIVHHSHIPVLICKHEDEHHKLHPK